MRVLRLLKVGCCVTLCTRAVSCSRAAPRSCAIPCGRSITRTNATIAVVGVPLCALAPSRAVGRLRHLSDCRTIRRTYAIAGSCRASLCTRAVSRSHAAPHCCAISGCRTLSGALTPPSLVDVPICALEPSRTVMLHTLKTVRIVR